MATPVNEQTPLLGGDNRAADTMPAASAAGSLIAVSPRPLSRESQILDPEALINTNDQSRQSLMARISSIRHRLGFGSSRDTAEPVPEHEPDEYDPFRAQLRTSYFTEIRTQLKPGMPEYEQLYMTDHQAIRTKIKELHPRFGQGELKSANENGSLSHDQLSVFFKPYQEQRWDLLTANTALAEPTPAAGSSTGPTVPAADVTEWPSEAVSVSGAAAPAEASSASREDLEEGASQAETTDTWVSRASNHFWGLLERYVPRYEDMEDKEAALRRKATEPSIEVLVSRILDEDEDTRAQKMSTATKNISTYESARDTREAPGTTTGIISLIGGTAVLGSVGVGIYVGLPSSE